MTKAYFHLALSFLLFGFIVSCQNIEQPDKDTTSLNAQRDAISRSKQQDQTKLNSLDSIKQVLNQWNEALNNKNYALLEILYTDTIQYYTTSIRKSSLITSKQKWLRNHQDYHQEIEAISIQHLKQENAINCVFNKKYTSNGRADSIRAILKLTFKKNKYLICKESDQASVLKRLQSMKGAKLKKGAFNFTHSYWLDTRDNKDLAHDFVRYSTNISLSYYNDTAKINMSHYSGSLRRLTSFHSKEALIEGQYISFKAAPNLEDADSTEIPERDYQYFKFKLLNQDEIALMETNGWFQEEIGALFWKEMDVE